MIQQLGTTLHGVPGISFATGSLGHGLSLAAGLALAARMRGRSHRVFCLTSDGEWQEGSTFEALIFAMHHRLGNLTDCARAPGPQHAEDGQLGIGRFPAERCHAGDYLRRSS